MNKADKMFEELGYEKCYFKDDKIDYIIYTKNHRYQIEFHRNKKEILCSYLLNLQELQAINEKCKELGWIE